MTTEIVVLYLITRLDSINTAASIVFFCGSFLFGILLLVYMLADPDKNPYNGKENIESYDRSTRNARAVCLLVFKRWWIVALCLGICIFVPTKKEAMFIIAGTGVIEAAKSETAQRLAGKSVDIVEKYLDNLIDKADKK